MNKSTNLLSKEESAELAGVSLNTVDQYAEFGLLEAVSRGGEVFFKESDIRSLFYTPIDTGSKNPIQAQPIPAGSVSNDFKHTSTSKVTGQNKAGENILVSDLLVSQKIVKFPTLQDLLQDSKENLIHTVDGQDINDDEISLPPDCDSLHKSQEQGQATLSSTATQRDHSELRQPEQDSAHFQALPSQNDLLQINRSLREQLEILKEERDWLRRRVENLETRSEREQMLLLAETQTVKNLLNQNNKKSFWNLAIPWFNSEKS